MSSNRLTVDAVQQRFAEIAQMLMTISENRPEFPKCRDNEPMYVE